MHSFDATIETGGMGGAFVRVPFDPKAALGSGRPKVKATFDGHPYRGSIANMGSGPILIVRKDVRAAIGKDVGERVRVTVEPDTEPRTVAVPDDLRAALAASAGATEAFGALAYTHRREYVQWIEEAKRPETRERRVRQTVEKVVGKG